MLRVTVTSGREGDLHGGLHGNDLYSCDRVDLQAVKELALAVSISTKDVACGRFRIDAAPVDSDGVADGHHTTVHIDRKRVASEQMIVAMGVTADGYK